MFVEVRATLQRFELQSSALEGAFEADLEEGGLKSTDVRGRFRAPAASLRSGNRLFDRDLHKLLEVRKYPEMAGEILATEATEDPVRYRVRGRLSVRGVMREVVGDATIVEADRTHAVLEGEMKVDIAEFSIEPPRLLILKVNPVLRIWGNVHAERAP